MNNKNNEKVGIIGAIYNLITAYKVYKAKKLTKKSNKAIAKAKVKQAKAQAKVAKLQKKVNKYQAKIDSAKNKQAIAIGKANDYVVTANKAKQEAIEANVKAEISKEYNGYYKEEEGFSKLIYLILIAVDSLTGANKRNFEAKVKEAQQKGQKAQKTEQKTEQKAENKTENKVEQKAENKTENKPIEGIKDGKKGYYFTNKKGEKKFVEAQYFKKKGLYGCYIGSTFYEISSKASKTNKGAA